VVYVALNWRTFQADPWEIPRLDHGGLVYYGGFGFGLLVAFWAIRWNRLPVWQTVDLMIPPLIAAHAMGRIGCFLNGCCYGRPTDVPWAVVFHQEGIPRHPTQIYESLALLVLFFILKRIERPPTRPGAVTLIYGLLYGAWRFFIEFFRGDNPIVWGGLTLFQWMSLFLMVLFGLLLLKRRERVNE
jgi:phosphatidylglycerol:prolipoprotein diacylglycerol transferase